MILIFILCSCNLNAFKLSEVLKFDEIRQGVSALIKSAKLHVNSMLRLNFGKKQLTPLTASNNPHRHAEDGKPFIGQFWQNAFAPALMISACRSNTKWM